MTQESLLAEDSAPIDDHDFPPVWRQGDQRLHARGTGSSRARRTTG